MTQDLHQQAYASFRRYLDVTYSYSGNKNILGMSTGYPSPGILPLPVSVLKQISGIDANGIEIPREGYGWESGSKILREKYIEYENKLHSTTYKIENICMVAGATYALNRILERLYEPSEMGCSRNELIVIAPTFYRMLGRASRLAHIISISGEEKYDYQVTADQILSAITSKTKAVFLLNPSNPAYLYYPDDFFTKLIPELEKRDIYLIIDESGDAFYMAGNAWSNQKFHSILGSDHVIRIITASKKYLLAEYRIGYVLASEKFMGNKQEGFIKLIGDDIGNPPFSANKPLLEIVENELHCLHSNDNDFFNTMSNNLNHLKSLRDYTIYRLQSHPFIRKIICPHANFNLVFCLLEDLFKSDIDCYEKLLAQTGVSLMPGSGLGISAENLAFRLTYALPYPSLEDGLNKILGFLNS